MTDRALPKVLMTDVIRSAQQGDAHGGAYLIDLVDRTFEKVLDWDRVEIDWTGRGMGRGLRGICFVGDEVWIAASDELFVFDRSFGIVRSHTCPNLHHCHEISYDGDRSVYLTSTSYDSILRFDVETRAFDRGWHLRPAKTSSGVSLGARVYDPMEEGACEKKDTLHINQVFWSGGAVYVSGLRMDVMFRMMGDSIEPFARVPGSTHNCQPMGEMVVMNSTGEDRVVVSDRRGRISKSFSYPVYGEDEMSGTDLGEDFARQGFGRGLCVDRDRGLVISGSSPGTVSAFDLGSGELVSSVNVSMDVRNAPHGLEIWDR